MDGALYTMPNGSRKNTGSVRVFEISELTDLGKTIEVILTKTGKAVRLPKACVQYAYKRIIIPEWLTRKILNEKSVPDLR